MSQRRADRRLWLGVALAGASVLLWLGATVGIVWSTLDEPQRERTADLLDTRGTLVAMMVVVLFGALAFGTAGYWAVTGATRTGEVSVVAPFRYTRLVFAILIGAFVFAEMPDTLTLLGAAMICGSGLYAFARERARRREAMRTLSIGHGNG